VPLSDFHFEDCPMLHRCTAVVTLLWIGFQCTSVIADELLTSQGGKIQCIVLQESEATVTTLIGESVIRFQRNDIERIVRAQKASTEAERTGTKLPSHSRVIQSLAAQSWAVDLHQIPATVIDKGVLKHVPYKSHRVAKECEINVYGDPGDPTGIEVGLFGKYLTYDAAKERCIEFVGSLLDDATNRAILAALKRDKDLVVHGDLTFEVTPPSADDAYGGWWISVYDEKSLGNHRAGDDELEAITTKHIGRKPSDSAPVVRPPPPSVRVGTPVADAEEWGPADYPYARPATSSSSGGRVYVRGYYRKDGTYVRPHTRRK
jgi:hypothetical protein